MANEIAAFFGAAETGAAAPAAVAAHLRRFWTPGMRAQLVEYARSDGAALSPLAREAVRVLDAERPA